MTAIGNNQLAIKNAQAYLSQEIDPEYRRQVEQLLHDQAEAELEDRFGGFLSFGTAGLRGKMEAGFRRINRVTIAQAAWSLAQYLLKAGLEPRISGVVIGMDARLNSAQFAEDAAGILTAFGIPVKIFSVAAPTPICAFAVSYLQVCAGVVITASHNPPGDNGFKVYWHTGAQITLPHTTGIADLMNQTPSWADMKRLTIVDQELHGLREEVGQSLLDAYFSQLRLNCFHDNANKKTPLKIVYTPLHGVGGSFVLRALKEAGFADVHVVEQQFVPDGNFPTVSFPNPEEDGALDLAAALAINIDADLILASDPDTDRLAVWIKDGNTHLPLSGNEIGWLLGEDALAFSSQNNKLAITTLVSSRMLSSIAASHQAASATTLTGFSHISRVALEREHELGEHFVFGYEEALGYCIGTLVRDKDGVSAAVRFAELTVHLLRQGHSIREELNRLALLHGLHKTLQWSIRMDGPRAETLMNKLMVSLRSGLGFAELFALYPLQEKRDLLLEASEDQRANMLILYLENNVRVIVRPSGTEQKIKFYLEGIGHAEDLAQLSVANATLEKLLNEIKNLMMSSIRSVQ